MKKAIAIILCALMLFVPVLTVSAADTGSGIKANELADAGQQTLYVGGKSRAAPKVDGVVEAGEYSQNYTFRYGDPGVSITYGDTDSEYVPDYIGVGVSYDDDSIWFGVTVQEDTYTGRSGNKTYSYFCLNLGFNQSGATDTACTRMAMTVALTDTDGMFNGNGYMLFDIANKKLPAATSWSYNGSLMQSKNFRRSTDEDGKNITVYEFQLKKSVLKTAFGVEDLDTAYFYFWSNVYDGTTRKCEIRYQFTLPAATKTALQAEYGWCATFVGHLMKFDYRDIETTDGASVRLSNPSGLRFETVLDKDFYDGLVAAYGAENVRVGHLIAPEKYVTEAGAFTKEALDALKKNSVKNYLEVVAEEPYRSDGECYTFVGSVTDILPENKTLSFAGIGYVEAGGRIYYSESWTVRSISEVAQSALADTSDTQSESYPYAVSEGVYSPYTESERAILAGFVVN